MTGLVFGVVAHRFSKKHERHEIITTAVKRSHEPQRVVGDVLGVVLPQRFGEVLLEPVAERVGVQQVAVGPEIVDDVGGGGRAVAP